MSYYTRCGKKVYFTKCGKKFVKATNAETTGFTCKTNEYWCRDSADCRKVISITCSKNKKGIAAKKRLAEKFFPCGE